MLMLSPLLHVLLLLQSMLPSLAWRRWLPPLRSALVGVPLHVWIVLVYVRPAPLLLGDVMRPFPIYVLGDVKAPPPWMAGPVVPLGAP